MKNHCRDFEGRIIAGKICARLNWEAQYQDDGVVLLTDYFGTFIRIVMSITPKKTFKYCLEIGEDVVFDLIKDKFGRYFIGQSVRHIIDLINSYVRTRPFTIETIKRGQHRLLDPDGFDYIGEWVTLKDARRSCSGNWYPVFKSSK